MAVPEVNSTKQWSRACHINESKGCASIYFCELVWVQYIFICLSFTYLSFHPYWLKSLETFTTICGTVSDNKVGIMAAPRFQSLIFENRTRFQYKDSLSKYIVRPYCLYNRNSSGSETAFFVLRLSPDQWQKYILICSKKMDG